MNKLPVDIIIEIFKCMRSSERILVADKHSILKRWHKIFVKTIVWTRLFRTLRPNGSKTRINTDKVLFGNISINPNNTEFFISEYKPSKDNKSIYRFGYNKDIHGLDQFIILGKNITKIELFSIYNGGHTISRQFFLKKDIAKFKPHESFIPISNVIFEMKIYADSIDRVFAKTYHFGDEYKFTMSSSILLYGMIMSNANCLYSCLLFIDNICHYYCQIERSFLINALKSKDPNVIAKIFRRIQGYQMKK